MPPTATPIEPTPVEPTPVEPTPVEPTPIDAQRLIWSDPRQTIEEPPIDEATTQEATTQEPFFSAATYSVNEGNTAEEPTTQEPTTQEPFFSAATYSVNEGNTAPITNRSLDLSPTTFSFRTGDGTALATGSQPDNSVVQAVNFAPGEASVQVPVQTLFDSLTESTETVDLFLSGGSLASPSGAVLSIIDPTAVPPTFFSYGSSPDPIIDGGSGEFTINRTGNTSVSASVDYLIARPGRRQPVNNVDFTIESPFAVNPSSGTVNFNPGQTTVSLTINNPLGLTGGVVNSGFGPSSIGRPASTAITLI